MRCCMHMPPRPPPSLWSLERPSKGLQLQCLLGSLQNFGRKTEMQFIPEREREGEGALRRVSARGFVKLTPSANRIAGSHVSFNPSACACAGSAMRARCPGWPPQ